MTSIDETVTDADQVRVIDLSQAAGRREAWDRPAWQVYLWTAAELVLVTNPWQPSSRLRARVLRAFGAQIGEGVVLRPRLRVKFPWKLKVGDRSWIGEDVWIHNQAELTVGSDAVVSQGTFITTGSHDFSGDMSLRTRPVTIEDGVAHIQLKRPEAMNSMIREFWNELPQIVRDIDHNARARAIVISSTGKHFSAGMDLAVFGGGGSTAAGQVQRGSYGQRQIHAVSFRVG